MLTYADMAFPRLPVSEELALRGDGKPAGSAFLRENVRCLRRWGLLSPTAWASKARKQTRLICTLIRNTQARTQGCQEAHGLTGGTRGEVWKDESFRSRFGGGRADGRAEWRDVKEMQSWGEYNGVSFRYDLIAPCSHHATFMVMRSAWCNGSLRACCSKYINVYTWTTVKTLKPPVYQKNSYTSTNMYIFREWSEIGVETFWQTICIQTFSRTNNDSRIVFV